MTEALNGVTFPAWRGESFIPIIDVVLVVGRWIIGDCTWSLADCEFATGWRGSAELSSLASRAARVSTPVLVDLVSDGMQLVDGELRCYADGASDPFLVLSSVRGDSWDVYASEPEVLSSVRASFTHVQDIPGLG